MKPRIRPSAFASSRRTILVLAIDSFHSLSFQSDNKILIFGSSTSSDKSVRHLVLLRLNSDGTRDTSFGVLSNGRATMDVTSFGGDGSSIAVQPSDGKIIVTGPVNLDATHSVTAVGRYWS